MIKASEARELMPAYNINRSLEIIEGYIRKAAREDRTCVRLRAHSLSGFSDSQLMAYRHDKQVQQLFDRLLECGYVVSVDVMQQEQTGDIPQLVVSWKK